MKQVLEGVWHAAFEILALALSLLTWMMVFFFNTYSWDAFRLFTWWMMLIQVVYFFSSIMFPMKHVFLRDLRHTGRILSIAMSVIFWVLFFYDRELILPKAADRVIGLNLLQHLVPPLLFMKDSRQFKGVPRIFFSTVIILCYSFLVLVWFLIGGTWPYPFMVTLKFNTYSMMTSLALTLTWVAHKIIIWL
jgi:hypothetical protein